MTKKQEPKFIHSKNMKENRYILSFIIFLLGSLSIHSQTHSDLRTTVEEALVSLKPEHLAIGEIKLDTLLLEKGNKLVVQMNDEFSYLPFRKELVKRAYDTIRSILPPDLKKKKLFILTDGYEISELIPFADNRKRFEVHCERPIVSPIKCHYLPTKGLQQTYRSMAKSWILFRTILEPMGMATCPDFRNRGGSVHPKFRHAVPNPHASKCRSLCIFSS